MKAAASTTGFIAGHLVWFAAWISLHTFGVWRFDPYPFSLLTLVVSVEAIVLTGFILRDQVHMAHVSDRRARLDLQIDLLAEQELTAILQVLCGPSAHVGFNAHAGNPDLKRLLEQTNVRQLATDINRELNTTSERKMILAVTNAWRAIRKRSGRVRDRNSYAGTNFRGRASADVVNPISVRRNSRRHDTFCRMQSTVSRAGRSSLPLGTIRNPAAVCSSFSTS